MVEREVPPPIDVKDMLATPADRMPLPVAGIVEVPTFATDNAL
jgi:hypothetical protein